MHLIPLLTAASLIAAPWSAHADDGLGAAIYAERCATCHGPDGTGGGPMVDYLSVQVPDLTRISMRNDGAFPLLAVVETIEGSTPLRAHGGPMPVFGRLDDGVTAVIDAPDGTVKQTSAAVLSVVRYLELLQR